MSKFLKWVQNVCFETVVSFASFEAAVQSCQIVAPAKLPKSLKYICEGVHFLVKF